MAACCDWSRFVRQARGFERVEVIAARGEFGEDLVLVDSRMRRDTNSRPRRAGGRQRDKRVTVRTAAATHARAARYACTALPAKMLVEEARDFFKRLARFGGINVAVIVCVRLPLEHLQRRLYPGLAQLAVYPHRAR